MAKNYDGLTQGSFTATVAGPGGSPLALAEDIRGGGIVVVANDSDRDASIDPKVLDHRMIIWHDSDSEYQYYDAGNNTRASDGTLSGGTWRRLQLGAEAGFGLTETTDSDNNVVFNVDTDNEADPNKSIATHGYVDGDVVVYGDWQNARDLDGGANPQFFRLTGGSTNSANSEEVRVDTEELYGGKFYYAIVINEESTENNGTLIADNNLAYLRLTVIENDTNVPTVLAGEQSYYRVIANVDGGAYRIIIVSGVLGIGEESDTDLIKVYSNNTDLTNEMRIEFRTSQGLSSPLFSVDQSGIVDGPPNTDRDFINADHNWIELKTDDSVTLTRTDSDLTIRVDTDWLDSELVAAAEAGIVSLGAFENVSSNVDNPSLTAPPALSGENKRHFIYDQTRDLWEVSREVIEVDATSERDADTDIGTVTGTETVDFVIPFNQFSGMSTDTDDDVYYDTDSDAIVFNPEIGMVSTLRFLGFIPAVTYDFSGLQAVNFTLGVHYQRKRPGETEWTTLNAPNTDFNFQFSGAGGTPNAVVESDYTLSDTELTPGTKFRVVARYSSTLTRSGTISISSTATVNIAGFIGAEVEFTGDDVDRRSQVQDSFLIYKTNADDDIADRWVSTRLIEDFSDTDEDGLKLIVGDTDTRVTLGNSKSSVDPSETVQIPIRFNNGRDSSNVFIYDVVTNAFEYVGAIDTDINITVSNLLLHVDRFSLSGTGQNESLFALQRSTNGGVSYQDIAVTETREDEDYNNNNNLTESTDYYYNGDGDAQGVLEFTVGGVYGHLYRLVYRVIHRAGSATLAFDGNLDSECQITATGNYHVLTGGFASEEYVNQELATKYDTPGYGLRDHQRIDD